MDFKKSFKKIVYNEKLNKLQSFFIKFYNLRILSVFILTIFILLIITALIIYYIQPDTLNNVLNFYLFLFIIMLIIFIMILSMQYISAIIVNKSYLGNFLLASYVHEHQITYTTIYGFIILLISFSAVILFFVLLEHPNLSYLNVLYILIGTILVSVLDKLLNRKTEEEKSKKVQQRIISVSRDSIKINIEIAKENLFKLSKPHVKGGFVVTEEFNLLDTYFWDLINSNITEIDLEPKILQDLLLIKNNVQKINNQIINTNHSDFYSIALKDPFVKKMENLIKISESLLKRF